MVSAKICGLKTPETVAAAVENGADFVGFVFFMKSPRALEPALAGALGRAVPPSVTKVGLRVPVEEGGSAEILGYGPEAAPAIVELMRRIGVLA